MEGFLPGVHVAWSVLRTLGMGLLKQRSGSYGFQLRVVYKPVYVMSRRVKYRYLLNFIPNIQLDYLGHPETSNGIASAVSAPWLTLLQK
jgi:hypothetical protein